MPVPPSLFTDPEIAAMQQRRTHAIAAVIDISSDLTGPAPDEATGFAYAMAHHRLEGAEHAARTGDLPTLSWYRGLTRTSYPTWLSAASTAHPLVVLAADPASMIRSGIADTPYVLIGPDSHAAPEPLPQLVAAAVSTAATAGFAELVHAHAPIVVLLAHKALGQTLDSWTISRLPGTVFTDHTNSSLILARDLIHEAGHNWLNAALTAHRTKVPDDVLFQSPWKATPRPAFGFLHACWAFPLTMLYTAAILDSTTPSERRYLDSYLHQQRQHLAQTGESHQRALDLITEPQLAERLHLAHHTALQI